MRARPSNPAASGPSLSPSRGCPSARFLSVTRRHPRGDYPSSILRSSPMKIGMISLGCPKNLVDSEVMLGLAQQSGHQLTRDAAEADVLIVNTCAFIDKAKQESVDAILEMAEHKKTGACRQLIVTGCMAERYRDELRAQIPEIDAILGTGQVPDIVSAIGGSTEQDLRHNRRIIPLL